MKRRIYKPITLEQSLEISQELFTADNCTFWFDPTDYEPEPYFNEDYEYEKMMDYKIWLRDCNCPAWAQ